MTMGNKLSWRFIWLFSFLVIAAIPLAFYLIGIGYSSEWTGFGSYTKQADIERAKTLWDWLDLIIAPLVIAFVGITINLTIRKNERDRARERAREDTLQSFLNRMEGFSVNSDFYDIKKGAVLRKIARTRTLLTLRRLDSNRKSILLSFLVEAGFVSKRNGSVIIDLSGADLQDVELNDADLEGAQLTNANLQRAFLGKCNLKKANLIGADLQNSRLAYCNLERAMFRADSANVRAQNINLQGADLEASILQGTDLRDALFDNHTVLPNGDKWKQGRNLEEFTNIDVAQEM